MIREWFIKVDGEAQGPYSIQDLRQDPRVTPDTFVRKQGWAHWRRLSDVKELQEVFEGPKPGPLPPPTGTTVSPILDEEFTLAMETEPPQLWLWFLFGLLVLVYVLLRLYYWPVGS